MSYASFDAALSAFKKSTETAMSAALAASQMALQHYAQHGDVLYLQRFYDAMPANFSRRVAFKAWVVAFAPALSFKKEQFTLAGNGFKPADTDVDGALAAPFWDFAPEKEVKALSVDAMLAMFARTLKQASNRIDDNDVNAKRTLASIRGALKPFIGDKANAAATADDAINADSSKRASLPGGKAIAKAA